MITVRRLGPGDEAILSTLATEAADFGLSDSGEPLAPLDRQQLAAYLGNRAVLHWAAFDDEAIVGTLVTMALSLPVSPGQELLLYDIGVRRSHRRCGVGTALVARMDDWMTSRGIATVWVFADGPGAVEFYRSCGFVLQSPAPSYMLRSAMSATEPRRSGRTGRSGAEDA